MRRSLSGDIVVSPLSGHTENIKENRRKFKNIMIWRRERDGY